MVEKDFRDEKFQTNLCFYIEYCYILHYIDTTDQKYIPRLIEGCDNFYFYLAPDYGNVYVQ